MDSITPNGVPGDLGRSDLDLGALLARADALRDARDWLEAAGGYAAYLRARPEDWAIWVQYGHCMKESGDVRAALLFYREAECLHPADSDLHVQIGHALKLLGRAEEAHQSYATALILDPTSAAAQAELLGMPAGLAPPPPPPPPPPPRARTAGPAPEAGPVPASVPAPAAAPPPPPATPAAPAAAPGAGTLVLDASDLLDYVRHNRAPTGIQRVQINVIAAALDQEPGAVLVAFDAAAGAWKALPAETFRRIAALSRAGADAADPAWTGAVAGAVAALLRAAPFDFGGGGDGRDRCLVNLGTFWWIPDYLRRVREAKARHPGLRYATFLYDCIPLAVPEHCAAGLVDEFARWFAGVCLHADLVLCISAATEAEFRHFGAALLPPGARLPPTAVLPLDAADVAAGAAAGGAAPFPPPAPLRSGRPYVLCVGTIESRKNHLLLFGAWLALLRRLGPAGAPDLVCVGKRGWLAEAALALHANSPALRGAVHLLHDVCDAALEALYRGCLFTVQASHQEGWGLPVTESLARGKVALVPDHSAFRESGAGGAVFYTPGDEPALVAALERLATDPAHRAAQEARIAREVRLRGWGDLTADLLGRVAPGAVARLPDPPGRAPPPLGAVLEPRMAQGPVPSLDAAVAEALREGPAWSVPEPWGCWTLPGTARLRVPAPPGTAGPLRVHLALAGPPSGPVRVGLRAAVPGRVPAAFRDLEVGAGERVVCTLDLDLPGEGDAAVELDCGAGVPLGGEGDSRDPRVVGAGVTAVMACRPDDLAARVAWLERMALPRVVRV